MSHSYTASASFLTAARDPAKARLPMVSQVALVGRSNVGKSTLLNRLGNNRKLARTSSTPGRTTEFNYYDFIVRTKSSQKGKDAHFLLVDLPGFGYAKFSKDNRESLNESLVRYIATEESLKAVCLLNDCRRDPEEDELAVRQVAFDHGSRLIVVLTKCDKLKRNELQSRTKIISQAYGLDVEDVVQSGEKVPLDDLWRQIFSALAN